MKEYEKVIRLVFAYFNKLKEEEPPKYMYEETKVYNDLQFTFMAPTPAKKMANSMAHRLNRWDPSNEHAHPIEELLYIRNAFLKFRKDAISEILELLTP